MCSDPVGGERVSTPPGQPAQPPGTSLHGSNLFCNAAPLLTSPSP